MGACCSIASGNKSVIPERSFQNDMTPYWRAHMEYTEKYSYKERTDILLKYVTINFININENIDGFIRQFLTKHPYVGIERLDNNPSSLETFKYDPFQYDPEEKTIPTMILTVDSPSSDTLKTVAKLLTGQRNEDILQTVLCGFSRDYDIPKDVIELFCLYYISKESKQNEDDASAKDQKDDEYSKRSSGHIPIATTATLTLKTVEEERAQKYILELNDIYKTDETDPENSDPLYMPPLALNWDKDGTVDINDTIENVANIMGEWIEKHNGNPAWKCILTRYDGRSSYVNQYSHRYDESCHADDNWYLWWMIDNDNKSKDESDCLVFKLSFSSYERDHDTYWGTRY